MQTAPFRTLCAMTLVAGVSCLADGPGPRRQRPTTAPGRLRCRRPARSRSRLHHARRQDRKTEKPPPKRLPRLRRLGLRPPRRMDRILRKTRTHRHAPWPLPIPRHTTRIPHQTRCVNPVARKRGRGGMRAAAPLFPFRSPEAASFSPPTCGRGWGRVFRRGGLCRAARPPALTRLPPQAGEGNSGGGSINPPPAGERAAGAAATPRDVSWTVMFCHVPGAASALPGRLPPAMRGCPAGAVR